jgi:hypothetical protein
VFPYPIAHEEEAEKIRGLIRGFREYAEANVDPVAIDRTGTIPDQVYRDLGELGPAPRAAWRARSTRSSATTTTAPTRSRGSPTSAAPTGTRSSRTD